MKKECFKGCFCSNEGFTLIELLVVVLIIGILAAVAVPQYQQVVLKTRLHTAISYVRAVKDAEEIYYLANGQYTDNIERLDVKGECPKEWTCEISVTEDQANYVQARLPQYPIELYYTFEHYKAAWKGKLYCYVSENAPNIAKQTCKNFGTLVGDNRYALN